MVNFVPIKYIFKNIMNQMNGLKRNECTMLRNIAWAKIKCQLTNVILMCHYPFFHAVMISSDLTALPTILPKIAYVEFVCFCFFSLRSPYFHTTFRHKVTPFTMTPSSHIILIKNKLVSCRPAHQSPIY